MEMVRKLGAGVAIAALAVGSVPAEAGRGPDRGHGRTEKVKAGDLLIGAAVVGLIAAIAGKKPKPAPAMMPPMTPATMPATLDVPPPDYAPPAPGTMPPPDAAPLGPTDPAEAAAVEGCVRYVGENYADEPDRFARVERISTVEPTAKGYRVRGQVRIDDARGNTRLSGFRCSINGSGSSRSLVIG